MKPTEKLPDLLEFFNIIARIQRLNEVFRLSGRIHFLYEVLCFILIVFDGFFLFLTVVFPLRSGSLEAIATFDAVVVLFLWVEYLFRAVSYTHLRAHETPEHLVCRLLLEKKQLSTSYAVYCLKTNNQIIINSILKSKI